MMTREHRIRRRSLDFAKGDCMRYCYVRVIWPYYAGFLGAVCFFSSSSFTIELSIDLLCLLNDERIFLLFGVTSCKNGSV